MPNLILNTTYNGNCYCGFSQSGKDMSFSWEDFILITKFVGTGQKYLNLLGGEPTQHKDFSRMLEYLIAEDFVIQVFTNGSITRETLNDITVVLNRIVLRENQLVFAVNMNAEDSKQQTRFLTNMGHLAFPTYTIRDKNENLLFLQDIVKDLNLDPVISLSLSMPIINSHNNYTNINDYSEIAKNIVELANNSEGTTIKLDCGFPLCMFSLEEIGALNQNPENDFMFVCGQPLDIYPDLTARNCYALANVHKVPITDFMSLEELYKYFEEGFMTPTGIYGKKCSDCTFFRKVCWGGCKGFYKSLNREQNEKD